MKFLQSAEFWGNLLMFYVVLSIVCTPIYLLVKFLNLRSPHWRKFSENCMTKMKASQTTKPIINIVIILAALLFAYFFIDDRMRFNSCLSKVEQRYNSICAKYGESAETPEKCFLLLSLLGNTLEALEEEKLNCAKLYK